MKSQIFKSGERKYKFKVMTLNFLDVVSCTESVDIPGIDVGTASVVVNVSFGSASVIVVNVGVGSASVVVVSRSSRVFPIVVARIQICQVEIFFKKVTNITKRTKSVVFSELIDGSNLEL